jgi:hypothetical protein
MNNKVVTDRYQRIIEHLQNSWQSLDAISPEVIARIATFITGLPEQYRKSAMKIVADGITNTMSLHLLSLMATFEQSAEQESISPEDCQETFKTALPETFRLFETLNKHLSVQSLDDLVVLSNVTGSLRILSQTTSAEEAQNWIDELPSLYSYQLKQENLISNDFLDWTQVEKDTNTMQSLTISASSMQQSISPISLKMDNVKIENKNIVNVTFRAA